MLPRTVNWDEAGFGARVHEAISALSKQAFAGDAAVHVKFLQVVPSSWLMMSMLPRSRPVVVTAQDFVMYQLSAPIGIGPLVAFTVLPSEVFGSGSSTMSASGSSSFSSIHKAFPSSLLW